jgi:hypothetical protein
LLVYCIIVKENEMKTLMLLMLLTFGQVRTPGACVEARCELLFETERPFVLYVFQEEHLAKLYDPAVLPKLDLFGTVVFWGWWQEGYVHGVGTQPNENGEFHPRMDIRKAIRYVQAAGMKAATHVHPGRWVEAGFTGEQLVRELERQHRAYGFDRAVWFDGADLGRSMDEAVYVLTKLRNLGWWIGLHDTITPFQGNIEKGRVYWAPPTRGLAQWHMWGETIWKVPSGPSDVMSFLTWLNGVFVTPETLPSFFPSKNSYLRGHADWYFFLLPKLLIAQYSSLGGSALDEFEIYRFSYEAERRKYREDPKKYVQDWLRKNAA